jgi:hypothetical protein
LPADQRDRDAFAVRAADQRRDVLRGHSRHRAAVDRPNDGARADPFRQRLAAASRRVPALEGRADRADPPLIGFDVTRDEADGREGRLGRHVEDGKAPGCARHGNDRAEKEDEPRELERP